MGVPTTWVPRSCDVVLSVYAAALSGVTGVFSAKYSWLSALSTACAGSDPAREWAPDCPYTQSCVPASTVKWLISCTSVPARESVPVSPAAQNETHT